MGSSYSLEKDGEGTASNGINFGLWSGIGLNIEGFFELAPKIFRLTTLLGKGVVVGIFRCDGSLYFVVFKETFLMVKGLSNTNRNKDTGFIFIETCFVYLQHLQCYVVTFNF